MVVGRCHVQCMTSKTGSQQLGVRTKCPIYGLMKTCKNLPENSKQDPYYVSVFVFVILVLLVLH